MVGQEALTPSVLDAFGLASNHQLLPGGSTTVYRVGDVVLKQIRETSLENNHSPDLAGWIAEFSASIRQDGFRVPRGIPTKNGQWVTPSGWTARSFVDGRHATNADIPRCITAIEKLHLALVGIAKHPLLDQSQTPWARANTWCLGDRPEYVHPVLVDYVTRLYDLRKPIRSNPYQVIHGDLNPENILVAPDLPPAFIDFSPFWAPPELAIAIFANWIGPRRGDAGVLRYFEDGPNFAQLLLRAAIRMLLVMSDAGQLDGWQSCSEKKAADIVLDFARTRFA